MTAVEWLQEQFLKHELVFDPEIKNFELFLFQEALKIEREQIIDAANLPIEERWFDATLYKSCGEQYYNETYKK